MRLSRLRWTAHAAPAWAGPPYVSDDPEPTEARKWEVYSFVSAAHVPRLTAGDAGLDINYGEFKDLQLTLVVPLSYERSAGTRVGLGDLELAAKYKLVRQKEGTWLPDVAVFPRVFLPTSGRGFGADRASLFLPIWAQKDLGKWSVFGGGGYDINPGPGKRNFWLTGVAATRQISERLSLGAEVYHQTPDAEDAKPFTGLNFGMSYRLNPHWSLLASGGPGVQNSREQGQYSAYLALLANY